MPVLVWVVYIGGRRRQDGVRLIFNVLKIQFFFLIRRPDLEVLTSCSRYSSVVSLVVSQHVCVGEGAGGGGEEELEGRGV